MRKIIALDIIVFLFLVLFIYAAVSKLLEYNLFVAQIGKSPLITNYAETFAWLVPSVELFTVLLLFIPRFWLIALYASFSLMFSFTAYVAVILTFSPYVPCSCGGILSSMGWIEHLIFNASFTFLAIFGIFLQARRAKQVSIANS